LRSGFRSVVDPQTALNRFIAETNSHPKPFVWTANPDRELAAVKRQLSEGTAIREEQDGFKFLLNLQKHDKAEAIRIIETILSRLRGG